MPLRTGWRAGCGIVLLLALGCTNTGNQAEAPVEKAPALPKQAAQSEPGPSDPDAPTEFTTTDSGLKYRVLRKGDGLKPSASDTVEVNYEGKLDDGFVFDSSYRKKKPISFPLNGVIKGWTEGLQHVNEGGKIELEIPGNLAYGSSPPPGSGIPPNATLHFIVELIKVK